MVVSAWCGAVSPRLTSTVVASGESWYFNLDIPGDDPETLGVKEGCSSDEIVSCKNGGFLGEGKGAVGFGQLCKGRLDRVFGYDRATSNMVAVGIPPRSHPQGSTRLTSLPPCVTLKWRSSGSARLLPPKTTLTCVWVTIPSNSS